MVNTSVVKLVFSSAFVLVDLWAIELVVSKVV